MTRELPYCSPGGCRHPKRYRLHKALQTSNPSSFCRRAASAIEPTGAEGCRPPPGSSDPGCAFAVCGLGLPLTQRSSPTWKWHWGLAAGSSSRPAGGGRPQAFWPTGHEPAGVGGRDWEVRLLLCPSLLVLLLHHTHVPSPPLHFPTDLLRISWNRITSPPPPAHPIFSPTTTLASTEMLLAVTGSPAAKRAGRLIWWYRMSTAWTVRTAFGGTPNPRPPCSPTDPSSPRCRRALGGGVLRWPCRSRWQRWRRRHGGGVQQRDCKRCCLCAWHFPSPTRSEQLVLSYFEHSNA